MLLEGAVDEAVVGAGALEENAVAHGLKEGGEAQRKKAVEGEEQAQEVVLDDGCSAVI